MSLDDALQEFGNAKAALGHALAVDDTPDKQRCDTARTAVLTAHRAAVAEAVERERERCHKIALDYAIVYMGENTHGDGRKCGEQIAAVIRASKP